MPKTLARSFAGGEITPEMFGRVDLAKFQTGLQLCRNFIVLPAGPAARRPGLAFRAQAKSDVLNFQVRLIPFVFSATQAAIIEFGQLYVRFHTESGTVLEAAKALGSMTQANPGVFTINAHGWANGDWVYCTAISDTFALFGQYFIVAGVTTNTFTLQRLDGTPLDTTSIPSPAFLVNFARVYTLASPYSASQLAELHFAQDSDILTITHGSNQVPAYELRRFGATDWQFAQVDFTPTLPAPTGVTATATYLSGANPTAARYKVTAVGADGVTESLPSDVAQATNNLTVAGNFNTVTWDAVNGAARYNVYKQRGGAYGYIGQALPSTGGSPVAISSISQPDFYIKTVTVVTSAAHGRTTGDRVLIENTGVRRFDGIWQITVVNSTTFTYQAVDYSFTGESATTGQVSVPSLQLVDDNVTPDTATTPPDDIIGLNDDTGAYPSAVTYFERRRWFGGTANKPQTIWATRNGTQSNLTSSVPAQDNDAMEFRIAAQQQNAIRHLMPLADIVALTVGGEFRVFADGGPAITPTTISIKPQGFTGASTVQPALARAAVMFVQAQGSYVNELTYDPSGTGAFKANDVSILATHLFDSYTLVELAYQRAPEPVLWALRSDGVLLGMTYVPDQQVFAWHQHETDGVIESIAVIPESNRDVLYVLVKRTIDGTERRYIERLTPRFFSSLTEAFFVDSGLTYRGAATQTITNLWHLEGRAVTVLADGAVVDGLTVTNGAITLPTAASVVHVGLAYTSDMQTLPQFYEGAPAAGQGLSKNVGEVYLRVRKTSSIAVGPTFSRLTENRAHVLGAPIPPLAPLIDGETDIKITPSWNQDGSVCVRQSKPLPATIVALIKETTTGG